MTHKHTPAGTALPNELPMALEVEMKNLEWMGIAALVVTVLAVVTHLAIRLTSLALVAGFGAGVALCVAIFGLLLVIGAGIDQ
jgi:hypothetical protein